MFNNMYRRVGVFLAAILIDLFAFDPLPFAIVPQVEPTAELADSVEGEGLTALGMNGMELVWVLSGVRIVLSVGDCSAGRDIGRLSVRNTLFMEQILSPSSLYPGSAGRVSISVRRDAMTMSRRYLKRRQGGQYVSERFERDGASLELACPTRQICTRDGACI